MQGAGFGQASPVSTIILSYLNLSDTLLVQPITMIKAESACKFEELQTDVFHMYTEHLFLSKADSWILSHTLLECTDKLTADQKKWTGNGKVREKRQTHSNIKSMLIQIDFSIKEENSGDISDVQKESSRPGEVLEYHNWVWKKLKISSQVLKFS